MKKNRKAIHSAATGRFVAKPLGRGKAEKFSQVEGLVMSRESATTLSGLKGRGLTGDALRSEIRGSFDKKR